MQSVSIFWLRIIEAQLLASEEVETLQQAIASAGIDPDADAIAAWLVSQKKISRYQATGCLTGAYTSFDWADFLIMEPIDGGMLQYHWRAKHIPTGQMVILLELKGNPLADNGHLGGLLNACQKIFAIDFPYFAPYEVMLHDSIARAILIDRGGTTLSSILAGGTCLSLSQSAAIAASIAEGLDHLHASGLFHGHICPETIWIPAKGYAQIVLIPPWLRAEADRGPLEPAMSNYAAPELNPARVQATASADLYALGCTLFEMLYGQAPFAGNATIEQKMKQHAQESIASLEANEVPAQMDQIVRYLMAKDTSVRYRSGSTVTEALQPFIEPADQPKKKSHSDTLQRYLQIASIRRQAELHKLRAAWIPPSLIMENSNTLREAAHRPATFPADIPIPHSKETKVSSSEASQAARAITLSNDDKTLASRKRLQKKRLPFFLVFGATLLAVIALGVTMARWREPHDTGRIQPNQNVEGGPRPDAPLSTEILSAPLPDADRDNKNKDDGTSLWASPTNDKRPQFRYLVPGPQMVLMAHLSRAAQPTWLHVLKSCDLQPEALNAELQVEVGFGFEEIERVDVGFYERSGKIELVSVFYLLENHTLESFQARWKTGGTMIYAGEPIHAKDSRCFYKPPGKSNVFCVGNLGHIEQIIDWLGEETTLDNQRVDILDGSLQPLAALAHTADVDRDVNLLFNTNFIRSSRDSLYPPRLQPLHAAITWLLGSGENIQAGLLSLNLSESFFCELQLFCARDKQPGIVAKEIMTRLQQAASQINQFLLGQTISRYSQATLDLAPDMLRALARYTRYDHDRPGGKVAILRSYLPANAAPHLAMATELLLSEIFNPKTSVTTVAALSFEQRMNQPITLSFGRDNLLQAVNLLSQESGILMKIIGRDLELEGITQNQSFEISMKNKPVNKILVEVLQLANPHKNLKLSANEQKLIYVIKQAATEDQPVIWITTRTAASKRGDTIPLIFTDEK
ncbi:MAG: protein kinase [Pirellulales bacterium]|nr:protein kinase [Pirellulales bacterium]